MAKNAKHYEFDDSYRNPFFTKQERSDELMKQYKKLAKVANERLNAIEKLSQQKHFENIDKYAYARAMHDIKAMGTESKRFPTKMVRNKDKTANETIMRGRINVIIDFLNSETSTKSGIINNYQKRVNTINERYDTNFTWQNFADLMSTKKFEKLTSEYGSKTALMMIGKLQHNENMLIELLNKSKSSIHRMKDDNVNKAIYKAMISNKLSPEKIFEGIVEYE